MDTIINTGGVYRSLGGDRGVGYKKPNYFNVLKLPFCSKINSFLRADHLNKFCREQNIENGTLIQMQNPSEKGLYFIDYGGKGLTKSDLIDDFLVVWGNHKGCFNYAASLDQSKNSGAYRMQSKRVLESQTYLILKDSDIYHAEKLLDNFDWLQKSCCDEAFRKWFWHFGEAELGHPLSKQEIENVLGTMSLFEVRLSFSGVSVHLKAARVVKMADKDDKPRYFVISMNSGKIWVTDEEHATIGENVSGKRSIMTNFIKLQKQNDSNYVLMK